MNKLEAFSRFFLKTTQWNKLKRSQVGFYTIYIYLDSYKVWIHFTDILLKMYIGYKTASKLSEHQQKYNVGSNQGEQTECV